MALGLWIMLTGILFLLSFCLTELKAIRKAIAPKATEQPHD